MPERKSTARRAAAAARRRLRRLRSSLARTGTAGTAAGTKRVAGIVEKFDAGQVTGWVAVPAHAQPVRVSLQVNAVEVAATWATDPMPRTNWGEARSFEFALHDVWAYCRKSDKLTVRMDGKSLPIAGHGMYLTPTRNGKHSLGALKERMAAGDVFGQTGRLQLSKKLDTEWQERVLGLYQRVREELTEVAGYDAMFMYGTLLGAVREGGVIGHDLDLDAAYVSRHHNGADAGAELAGIALELIDRGFNIDCMRTALHIHLNEDPALKIDLFHLYFDHDGKLAFPFGVAGTTEITEADWQGTEEIEFLGHRGVVPVNAEAVVEHVYGPGWRSPKPGFDWARDRTKRAAEGIMPTELSQSVAWSNFYAHHRFDAASPFARHCLAALDTPYLVLDLGCGDGRDARLFAAAGHPTLGVDRSKVGVRHAVEQADAAGLDGARFKVADLGDELALRGVVADARQSNPGLPTLFYLRFLLHAVPPAVQDVVMGTVQAEARPGDLVAVEFRADEDKTLPKARRAKYRRFQDGPAFGSDLERRDFVIKDSEHGTGLAPFADEDPYVYRAIAQRQG